MFKVKQTFYGKFVAFVGNTYPTEEAAQQECEASARADWESTGAITPATSYEVVPA